MSLKNTQKIKCPDCLLNKASDPSTQQKFDLFNKATLVPQLIVKSRIINTFAISPSPFKYRSPPCALTIS